MSEKKLYLYEKKGIVESARMDANKQLIVGENNKGGKGNREAPY